MWETDSETYNGLTVKKRAGTWNGINKEIIVQEGKTYTFSVFIKSDSNRQAALYTSGGTSGILDSVNKNITTNWERYSLTFTANKTGTVKCRVENTTSIEGNYTYICGYQIEEGSTATSYVAHQEQNYTITLPTGMELCKIGNYKDYIYKSGDNWYKKAYIGKVIFDGSNDEEWSRAMSTNNLIARFGIKTIDYLKGESTGNIPTFISNYFNPVNFNTVYDGTGGGISWWWNNDIKQMILCLNNDMSLENFKIWLSNNPVTVYYIIAIPTEAQITDTTLINQLNDIEKKLKTYQGVTHITQTNSDMPFILTLDYKKSNLLRIQALENA